MIGFASHNWSAKTLRRALFSRTGMSLIMALVLAILPVSLNGCSKPQPPGAPDVEALRQLVLDGYYSTAEEEGRRLLKQWDKSSVGENLEHAELTELLAMALRDGGKFQQPETMRLALKAVDLKVKLLGPDHLDVASAWYALGYLQWKLDQNDDAWTAIDRARQIQEANLGADHPGVARSLVTLGVLHYHRENDLQKAMTWFERARTIQDAADLPPTDQDVAWRLMQEACLLSEEGDYRGAITLVEQELEIRTSGLQEGHPHIGRCHHNLGCFLRVVEDYTGSRNHLEKNLEIRLASLGPDHENVGRAMSALAVTLVDLGDLDAAGDYYEQALVILVKSLGKDHTDTSWCQMSLADLLGETGEFELARWNYEQVLAACARAGAERDGLAVNNMVRLGALLLQMGDLTAASEIYGEAREILVRVNGPDDPYLAVLDHNQAAILLKQKRFDQAKTEFTRVLTVLDAAPEGQTEFIVSILINLAICSEVLGDDVAAMGYARRAEGIARDQITETSRLLEERLALTFAGSGTMALNLTVAIAAGCEADRPRLLAQAFDTVVNWRALCLDELVNRRRAARAADDPRLASLQEDLREKREAFSRLAVAGDGDQEQLAKAQMAKERAERLFAEKSLAFRGGGGSPSVEADSLGDALPAGSSLVAFFRYEDGLLEQIDQSEQSGEEADSTKIRTLRDEGTSFSYLAFVLRSGATDVQAVNLGPAADLEGIVTQWRQELQRGIRVIYDAAVPLETEYRQVAARLRQTIWDPVAPLLDGSEQVFIVPDGALHLVNFAALAEDDGRYLVQNGLAFHYLAAERELRETERSAAEGKGLLALGDPAFGELPPFDPNQALRSSPTYEKQYASLSFVPLPQTGVEAERISLLWRALADGAEDDALLLTGNDATEEAFKALAPGKRCLHLATHGFFLEPRANTASEESDALADNPLLRAGLALAGANQRETCSDKGEDGILTAEEIAGLDLGGVEWAVLSGCGTGLGSIRAGEGVFGLRRAFQLAGVRTVVMSLWPVEDQAARLWMEAFYTAKGEQGEAIASAVRSASLAIMERQLEDGHGTHPFFWAPFVASGDWR